MISSVLQVAGLAAISVGVGLLAGVGFAVVTVGAAAVLVGVALEKANTPKAED